MKAYILWDFLTSNNMFLLVAYFLGDLCVSFVVLHVSHQIILKYFRQVLDNFSSNKLSILELFWINSWK